MPRFLCVFVAALNGFLFGYQTAVIAGAMLFIKQEFQLSAAAQGVAVSMILLGALAASLAAGTWADRFGRKSVFWAAGLLFVIGTWIASEAMTANFFLAGRFLTGAGIGLTSVVTPMYLGEIAPVRYRGTFISFYQLAITIGILAAYGINLIYAEAGDWRWMLVWGAFPALIQMVCLPFLCESPDWLIGKGFSEKARAAAQKIGSPLEVSDHPLIEQKGWKSLAAPKLRLALFVGLALSCFQQVTGINAVIYYAPQVFELVGFPSAESAIFATLGMGVINVLATSIAVVLLDRLGRKALLIAGLAGMALALGGIAGAFLFHWRAADVIAAVALTAYVVFFAIGLGPVTWVIIAEIYPVNLRGKAVSLAILLNWLCNYFVTLTFLILVKGLGAGGTFVLFGLSSLAGLFFVCRFIPETKGKTHEEIERLFL